MDTVRAISEVELVFMTVWRIRLAPNRSVLYIMWLKKIMNLDMKSIYSRHGEVEGTLNSAYT